MIEAINLLLDVNLLVIILVGFFAGLVLGAIPGLGSIVGVAIAVPLTIFFEPHYALLLLVAIYEGGVYGSSITAILMNVPGNVGAAATTFDGYPMTRSGKAVDAITIGGIASGLGGALMAVSAILLVPLFSQIVLMFHLVDYFLIAFLGITLIARISEGSLLKGIMIGIFGFLITTIGMAETVGYQRYTFDSILLFDGLNYIAILLALFAITEMIKLSLGQESIAEEIGSLSGNRRRGFRTLAEDKILFIKSTLIGAGAGLVPGSGPALGSFLSYSEAVRSASDPDSFGEGNPKGLIAAESANTSAIVGALIPTITFGVPGSGVTAVILAALISHGITPGPVALTEHRSIIIAFFLVLIFTSFLIVILSQTVVPHLGRIATIDVNVIIPMVIVATFIGTYSIRTNWIDLITLIIFGILGFYMVKNDFSIIAFVLGVVLGPIVETYYLRSITLSDNVFQLLTQGPVTPILFLVVLFFLFEPLIRGLYNTMGTR